MLNSFLLHYCIESAQRIFASRSVLKHTGPTVFSIAAQIYELLGHRSANQRNSSVRKNHLEKIKLGHMHWLPSETN